MAFLQKVIVDCSRPIDQPQSITVTLTAGEIAAYNAQQPIGQAAAAAEAAVMAVKLQHQQALAQLKPTLVGNATTMANDITAIQALIASIEAGTPPTAAQLLQVLRFVLRVLAVLNS